MPLTLHGYWRSSSAWRVRIALHWKGLSEAVNVPVHLVEGGGQQHSAAHRALNPMRQVPVLVVGEGITRVPLGQSMAILEYLEERHPEPPLLPADPIARARARQLAEVVNSGIQPLQNLRLLQRLKSELGASAETARAFCGEFIREGLVALETLVSADQGQYCVGDAVSFADVLLVPQLYNARRFNVDLSLFPHLLRVEAALTSLPAFQRSHPSKQADAV